jgi:uncharacterized protein (TIGR04540 family)
VNSLQVKLFYKTQRDLAVSLNEVIDAYWDNQIDEHILINSINDLYIHNSGKVIKDGKYTTVVQQQCGKRRLEVIDKIIKTGKEMD